MTPSGPIVFLCGAVYELATLGWLHLAAQRRPIPAALASMAVGALSLYAISAVVRGPDEWPWLIAGYGVGSWLTVRFGSSEPT